MNRRRRPRIPRPGSPGERFSSLLTWCRGLLRNRFAMLSILFGLCGAMILVTTASLQLTPAAGSQIAGTTGVTRQRTISATRGDIFDRYGTPLAVSKTIRTLSIASAGLDNTTLNAMLLDFARTLEENGETYDDSLSEHFAVSPLRFIGTAEETTAWQSDKALFHLKAAPEKTVVSFYDKSFIKTDPYVFYRYLRETLFGIAATYSEPDAFRIMRLRYRIYRDAWAFRQGTPIPVASDVKASTVRYLEEQNYRFQGVLSSTESRRVYLPDAMLASHVIGYVGAISSRQYEELDALGYSPSEVIGQSGVESYAERYLHGQDGVVPYNIWSSLGADGIFFSESSGRAAVAGFDVRLTLDMTLQKVAIESLVRNIEYIKQKQDDKSKNDADSGAVVMMDVHTGEILAMASYPYFDPNDFVLAATDKAASKRVTTYLTDTKDKPMLNRAIMENYAPGSTFKPLTAIASLESGTITPKTVVHDPGKVDIGGWTFRCLEYPVRGHGDLSLTRGMATSCNIFFQLIGTRTGIDMLDHWGNLFGLGEYSGIDLPGEVRGIRASKDMKKRLRMNPEDQVWFPADTAQTSIGQFDNSFTVLQLCRYTAALANGGYLVTPHVVKDIIRPDGSVVRAESLDTTKIPVQDATLQAVREAMMATVTDPQGTARRAFKDFPISVACKTGTAETGLEDRASSNALFICYAPADDPQVAIAQIVEKGVWGSNTAGIARDLLTAYFDLA